jgi:glutaconyl-CoA/methylmalonyl-CoA decarboxylase subunit gamma
MIKKLRVTVDGKAYDVTVEMPDDAAPAAASPRAASAEPVSTVSSPAPAPVLSAGPGEVVSPLAGRVTAIAVKAGQAVKQGDHLLTLEAMKMNTFVVAPRDGKIAAINVGVGDAVNEGQPLVRIE